MGSDRLESQLKTLETRTRQHFFHLSTIILPIDIFLSVQFIIVFFTYGRDNCL